jgi:hypothetical protein
VDRNKAKGASFYTIQNDVRSCYAPLSLGQHEDRADGRPQTTEGLLALPPRRKKAQTLRDKDWEPFRTRVFELHITNGLPLKEVKAVMQREYGFSAEYVSGGKTMY